MFAIMRLQADYLQLASWPQNGIALFLSAQVARLLNSKLKRNAVFLLGEFSISTGYKLTGHARSNGSLFRVALSVCTEAR